MIVELIKRSADAVALVQDGCFKVCEMAGF